MATFKSKYTGVRYREHPTRKNGIRRDRYFFIRYKLNGKTKEEAIGWESEHHSEKEAFDILCEIKANIKAGAGFFSLKEKSEQAAAEKAAATAALISQERDNTTYCRFFEDVYCKIFVDDEQLKNKKSMHKYHILPVIGDMTLKEIKPIHIETIKSNMAAKGRAAASINKALVYISHVFNTAKNNEYYTGDNPIKKVKKCKVDNRRIRFLTREEASLLFKHLPAGNVYDMALLALCCGLRAGEIFKLQAMDINFNVRRVYVRDPKGVINRAMPMPQIVFDMLQRRCFGKRPSDYLFMKTDGSEKIVAVSDQYQRVADKLFNTDITDPRNKVVFHTLRHTFASWLAMDGVDINTISELMGHATLEMTKRYMHLAPNKLDSAITCLENPLPLLEDNTDAAAPHSAANAEQ
ncbi:MAG: site-specific integrase [Alphaproteobacteria bacterium]|nr:site-specific integrase [Alphaproteobacteria bacterium]